MNHHRIPKVGKRIYAPLTEPGPGALVDLYVRYSSDNQSGESIETQLRKLRDYAEHKGWVVRKEWVDAEHSAKYEDIAKRPVFAECLAAVKAHQMHAVLCLKMDRWSRNQSVLYETFNIFMEHQVWWVAVYGEQTLNKQMDPAGGRFLIAFEAAQGEGALAYLSREVVDGLRTRGEQGYHRGAASFGYEVVYPPRPAGAPANWEPPRTAMTPKYPEFAAVQLLGACIADGMGERRTASILNESGYLFTPSIGKRTGPRNVRTGESYPAQTHPFTNETVRYVRKNPIYRAFAPDSDRGTILLARESGDVERFQGEHVAAWDWDLCQRMDTAIARRQRNQQPNMLTQSRSNYVYPLAGIITCYHCGEVMRVHRAAIQRKSHLKVHFYYRCSSKTRHLPCSAQKNAIICDTVHTEFGQWLTHHQLGATWRDDLEGILARDAPVLSSGSRDTTASIQKLERQRELLHIDAEDGIITLEDYRAQSRKLKTELEQLQALTQTMPTAPMIKAATQLATIPECWELARMHEDKLGMSDLVHAMMRLLVWNLDTQQICGCVVYPEFVPAVRLTLPEYQHHQDWLWDTNVPLPDWITI